jgi:hypothetical protein
MIIKLKKNMKELIYLMALSIFFFSCVSASENDILKAENKQLRIELQEIKNGAEFRLNEIIINFKNKNYSKLKILVDSLNQIHPNSEESNQAILIGKKAEKIIYEKEKKEKAEKDLKELKQLKNKQEKFREIIRIKKFYSTKPNSSGGVDFNIIWQNRSNKTIKYATFKVEPYNAVGDIVNCTIRNTSTFSGKVTGPIKDNKWNGYGTVWSNAWYNNTIKKIEITAVYIDYTDSSTEFINNGNIKHVIY